MTPTALRHSARMAVVIGVASTLALAVAMGVGRFAFTPMFPLMVRDGLLQAQLGAWLAASNYLGYLVGALVAAYVRLKPATLLTLGLLCTVLVTAAMGWTKSSTLWLLLRFVAGVMSAWTLVATSAWGLRWLAALGRPRWAGIIYAGVGTGIAAAGLFCWWAATPEASSAAMWVDLGAGAAVVASVSLLVSWKFHTPMSLAQAHTAVQADSTNAAPSTHATGLIVCYTLFGFGYILPATYLPALARQLVDDPQVFGLAWPLFGAAAAVSTLVTSWGLGHLPRIRIWAASQGLMALGVWLPSVWPSLVSISVAALLVGGTFMVITMLAMQEARARSDGDSTALLGQLTAGFALGQLLGPLVSAGIAGWVADDTAALHHGLWLSAAGLLGSAVYLWRK